MRVDAHLVYSHSETHPKKALSLPLIAMITRLMARVGSQLITLMAVAHSHKIRLRVKASNLGSKNESVLV